MTLISENFKIVAILISELHLSEGLSKSVGLSVRWSVSWLVSEVSEWVNHSVGQSVSQSFSQLVNRKSCSININFHKGFMVDLNTFLDLARPNQLCL